MKDSVLKNILVNLKTVFTINLRKRINQNSADIQELQMKIAKMELDYKAIIDYYMGQTIQDYYSRNLEQSVCYEKELAFLKKNGSRCAFPYDGVDTVGQVEAGRDTSVGLPFVIHHGRRLFFPDSFSVGEAVNHYKYMVNTEKLLGVCDDDSAPHQYQSDRVCVEDGDAVFDIGSAEGLLALDVIDRASHVVLVERDEQWLKCLHQTFAPYGDKVSIVKKYLCSQDIGQMITLPTLLSDYAYDSAFIKMDIEGAETQTIRQASAFLKNSTKTLKFSLATYHKQEDSRELKQLFDEFGYFSEFSKGYMLFGEYDTPKPPYFRHGIIRAKNGLIESSK